MKRTKKRTKQNEMGRILSNIFVNIRNYEFDSSLREKIEYELKESHQYSDVENITYADLAEYLFQVGGFIFNDSSNEKDCEE